MEQHHGQSKAMQMSDVTFFSKIQYLEYITTKLEK